MKKIYIIVIIFFLYVISVAKSSADDCKETPKFIFTNDVVDNGKRVLILNQNQLCQWDWTDPYSPEDAKFLQGRSSINVKANLEKGDGKHIASGDPIEGGRDWRLFYDISYTTKSGEFCHQEIIRNVRISQKPENPCEKELKPCGKEDKEDTAECHFNIRYKNCKQCTCKVGCQPGQNGAEYSCVDRKDMCRTFGYLCPTNTTCHELNCPEVFGCHCNKGFVTTQKPEFNCKSENECALSKPAECVNKDECSDKFVCPPHSRCVDTWPPEGHGCNDDPLYPDRYPANSERRCGYSCECLPGYHEERGGDNKLRCVKQCSKKCPPNSYCEFTDDEREVCVCPRGFRYVESTNECVPINRCEERTDDCHIQKPGSECKYTGPGDFICVCPPGKKQVYDESTGKQVCINFGKCESGNHTCMRNSKDGVQKQGFNSNNDVMNSYCEDYPNQEGYRCVCDSEDYAPLKDCSDKLLVCFLKEKLDFWLLPKQRPDMRIPHFSHQFRDPSYELHSEAVRTTCSISTPSEFYRRPLDICGVYKIDYTLDLQPSELLVGYPAHVKTDPCVIQNIKKTVITKTRNVEIFPVDYCDDNLSHEIEGVEIDNKKAIHDCARNADCSVRLSPNWKDERQLDSCNYTCNCYTGRFENKIYSFTGQPYGRHNECKYPKLPHIYFKEGLNHTLPNTPENRDLFDIDLTQEINVYESGQQCVVCKTKISGTPDLSEKDLTDHGAFYPYPVLEKINKKYQITRIQYFNVRDVRVEKIVEIDSSKISKDVLNRIIPRSIYERLGNCRPNEPCIKVYVVSYRAEEDGNTDLKKRIVYTPIMNVELYIDKVRDIVYWLEIIYQVLTVFFVLAVIYLLFVLLPRLYACFQYFILGKNDKNNARLAWDTIYYFRHPFDTQSRNQLTYQALYMD
eukprot:TRINITY_DN1255_c0_g1_i1.p1 TRINITY_DN1255_c0_g1~~TRINITY_DN1255_c0_g1_i1.p1  ORF type:complete len:909 (+),score=243.64 TRINITY_DN1255_c0_g1_i1:59-2785(+)